MYKKMYYHLFNALTDAIELLEVQEYQKALNCLTQAQKNTEELYILQENQFLSTPDMDFTDTPL